MGGNYFEPHTAAYSVHNSPPSTTSTHHSFTPSLSFPEAVKIYFAHHEKAWAPRTAAKKRNILERFLEIVSKDRPGLTVKDISQDGLRGASREHFQSYRTTCEVIGVASVEGSPSGPHITEHREPVSRRRRHGCRASFVVLFNGSRCKRRRFAAFA